jgi:hypothetical protein
MHNSYNQPISITISSNTLFHFTNGIHHITSILKDGFFRPNLSLEDLSFLKIEEKVAIPMISFCDIPLSQTKLHTRVYGYYGIGLSKSWGQRNGLSPVLYTHPDSPLTLSLRQCLAWTHRRYLDIEESISEASPFPAPAARAIRTGPSSGDQYLELWDQLLRIQCFIKPYEGPLHRGSQSFPNIRFYDEREWRFVPELAGDLFKYLLDENDYNNFATRKKANREIQTRSRLCFEPPDIKYIIIAREKEILPMIRKIEEIGGDRDTQNQLKVLSSNIISAERIAEDF